MGCLFDRFSEDISSYTEKQKKYNEDQSSQDALLEISKKKMGEDNRDIFDWLGVNTRFSILKKKLRQRMVEIVNTETSRREFDHSYCAAKKGIP
jgi:hypothetical protein